MATELATYDTAAVIEQVIAAGDLDKLTPAQRTAYYVETCRSLGLNPMTKPFDYIKLNNRLVLYATKGATDQLRQIHGVSLEIVSQETVQDLYVVTVQARTADGRTDADMGAVSIKGATGDALVNAMLKAVTKAKRRVTLSICGLGMLDETEVETIPHAAPALVDAETGEIGPAHESATGTATKAQKLRIRELAGMLGLWRDDSREQPALDARSAAVTGTPLKHLSEQEADGLIADLQRELDAL